VGYFECGNTALSSIKHYEFLD